MSGWVQKTFCDFDMPVGRTPESFAYKLESIWSGRVVDTYYTDEVTEAERVLTSELSGAYNVRVTHDGISVTHLAP